MEVSRKKVLLFNLEEATQIVSGNEEYEDFTDYRLRKDVIGAIHKHPNISYLAIIAKKPMGFSDEEFSAMMNVIELSFFVYCHVATKVFVDIQDVFDSLPTSLKKKDNVLYLGKDKVDFDSMDFNSFVYDRNTD